MNFRMEDFIYLRDPSHLLEIAITNQETIMKNQKTIDFTT